MSTDQQSPTPEKASETISFRIPPSFKEALRARQGDKSQIEFVGNILASLDATGAAEKEPGPLVLSARKALDEAGKSLLDAIRLAEDSAATSKADVEALRLAHKKETEALVHDLTLAETTAQAATAAQAQAEAAAAELRSSAENLGELKASWTEEKAGFLARIASLDAEAAQGRTLAATLSETEHRLELQAQSNFSLTSKIAELADENKQAVLVLAAIRADLSQSQTSNAALKAEVAGVRETLARESAALSRVGQELSQAREAHAAAHAELAKAQTQAQDRAEQIAALKADLLAQAAQARKDIEAARQDERQQAAARAPKPKSEPKARGAK